MVLEKINFKKFELLVFFKIEKKIILEKLELFGGRTNSSFKVNYFIILIIF